MELFSQYQTLFTDAINSGRIGVCKWIESGTTIDTALPELSNLTDDKKEWRAIIIRYVDDNLMSSFSCDKLNPYDFLINKDQDNTVKESPIPLVRLTQMLGGIPPLEVEFKAEIVREEYKAPRTVYVPIEDAEKEKAHQALVQKYKFDGKAPAAILIITVRNSSAQDESIGRAWIAHKESDSSEFWKRNHFPSICRFMVYDFAKQGPIQKNADEFGFWYSVMLMSINEWDSSTIQAYRLYTIKTKMDPEKMEESFQALADKLRDAKHYLEKSIKKDIEDHISEEEALPEYKIDVPVALKLPNTEDRLVKNRSFPLLSRGSSTDVAVWTKQRAEAEEEYESAVRTAERTLEQTADKMRSNCTFSEDEVFPLNKYQTEDLNRETMNIYHNIIDVQGRLPKGSASSVINVSETAGQVRKYLLGRIMTKPAILTIVFAAVLVLLSVVPALIQYFQKETGSWQNIMYIVAAAVLITIGCAALVLLIQKLKLNALIRGYNQSLQNAFSRLVDSAADYSDYMTSIASHSRGKSYLNLSERIKHYSDDKHYSKYKHIKAVNILLGKLRTWSKAYHLNVDFSSKRPETRMEIDLSTAPVENKLYAFETGSVYPVAINNSGMTMDSPYPFAEQIEIVREELYDD